MVTDIACAEKAWAHKRIIGHREILVEELQTEQHISCQKDQTWNFLEERLDPSGHKLSQLVYFTQVKVKARMIKTLYTYIYANESLKQVGSIQNQVCNQAN